jgi:hypothetical protein
VAYFSIFQSGILHAEQTDLNHLFLNWRAARLLREFRMVKVSLQWVVMMAISPRLSTDRMPWSTPLRDGQILILSISRKSSMRLR